MWVTEREKIEAELQELLEKINKYQKIIIKLFNSFKK